MSSSPRKRALPERVVRGGAGAAVTLTRRGFARVRPTTRLRLLGAALLLAPALALLLVLAVVVFVTLVVVAVLVAAALALMALFVRRPAR